MLDVAPGRWNFRRYQPRGKVAAGRILAVCWLLLGSVALLPPLMESVRAEAPVPTAGSFPPPPPPPGNNSSFRFYWETSTPFGLPGVAETFTAVVAGVNGTVVGSFWFSDGSGPTNFTMNGSTHSISHTFSSNGSYQVLLNITSTQESGESLGWFQVAQTQTVANVTLALDLPWASGDAPLAVFPTFLALGGTAPYAFQVNFGNGVVANYSSPASNSTGLFYANATYPAAGVYTIVATVTDALQRSVNISSEVYVWSPPLPPFASISASPTSGSAPLTVRFGGTFDNASFPGNFTQPYPAYRWNWSFGDGGSGSGSQISHTYTKPGTYDVLLAIPYYFGFGQNVSALALGNITVTVTSGSSSGSGGNSSNHSGGAPLRAAATLISSSGASKVTASFEISVSGGSLPYSVQVVFGDGSYGIAVPGQTVAHLYAKAGSYDPYAIVTDGKGASVTVTLPTITVHAASSTAPAFAFPPDLAIYALVGAMLGLTLASAFLVRSRGRRRQSRTDEGEAIVRELLRPPEP